MSATLNGKPQRKQLSDQLDRFDTVLNGLAEGLNETIADAVRDGTRLALKDAVIEILTDPELRKKLQQAAAGEQSESPSQTGPGFWGWLKAKVAGAFSVTKTILAPAVSKVAQSAKDTATVARSLGRYARVLRNFKGLLYVGVAAGIATAAFSLFAPHTISAVVSGLSGAIAAMALRATIWTRRAVGTFPTT